MRCIAPRGIDMEDIKLGKGSISVWGALVAIGGFLAFLGFFLAITEIHIDGGWGFFSKVTGLDMLRGIVDGEDMTDEYTFWRFMPFIAGLVGLAVVIIKVLPFAIGDKPAFKTVGLGLGIAVVVLAVLVLALSAGSACFEHTDGLKFYRGIGAFFMLYGGIIAVVGSFLDIKGVKI